MWWFGKQPDYLPRKRTLCDYYTHITGRTDSIFLSRVGGRNLQEGGAICGKTSPDVIGGVARNAGQDGMGFDNMERGGLGWGRAV